MTTAAAGEYRTIAIVRVGRARAFSVAGAVLTDLAVWVIAVPILGLHLTVRFGSGPVQSIGADFVVGASLVASLVAWGLLAAMERRISGARTIWTFAAVAVLLASLGLPLAAGTTATTKTVLAVMHGAAALVLILGLRAGARSGA